jgi:hypothetical protein
VKAKAQDNGHAVKALIEGRLQAPQDPGAKAKWPTLTELLDPVWTDGKCMRQSGSLRIRLVGGYYLVTLACPTEGLETTMTTDTLVDAFDALEAMLVSGKALWMPDWNVVKKSRQAKID